VTAEYRAKSRIYACGTYTFGGGTFGDICEGNLKSWLFLANAYADLGTWYCLTPFDGVGDILIWATSSVDRQAIS